MSNRWTQDQLTLTLALYFQIPFGQMHSRTPKVIELAETIDRTPSAVAFKLGNFASFDPDHKARGVSGLPNTSAADREIWDRFYGNWNGLDMAVQNIKFPTVEPGADRATPDTSFRQTETTVQTKARLGQSLFRQVVLASYHTRCCITGIEEPRLLRASHIVPWSTEAEHRLDPCNGLCLSALHDAAFDSGLITITADHLVTIAEPLRHSMSADVFISTFARYENHPIELPERFAPTSAFLDYHRDHVFIG